MMRIITIFSAVLAGLCLLASSLAWAGEESKIDLLSANKAVDAVVVRVIDADTVKVDAEPWPDIFVRNISVRISGIDTPEKSGTGCKAFYQKQGKAVPKHIKIHENELGCLASAFVGGSELLQAKSCGRKYKAAHGGQSAL